MKTLPFVLGACALALGTAGAAGAQEANTPPATAQPGTAASQPGAAGLRSLDDMRLVGPGGERIGEIENALVDATGQVVAVSAEVGGFLGVGDKDVVIRLDQLELQGDQYATTMTREELEALPDWDDD